MLSYLHTLMNLSRNFSILVVAFNSPKVTCNASFTNFSLDIIIRLSMFVYSVNQTTLFYISLLLSTLINHQKNSHKIYTNFFDAF